MSALDLTDKLEKQWDADLFNPKKGLAPLLGWKSYHTLTSKGSAWGFPDRTLWKGRMIFAELKRELTGRKSEDAKRIPTPRQIEVLDDFVRAGCEVYLWRPSDLDEIAKILGKPWQFNPSVLTVPPRLFTTDAGFWVPNSTWVPGVGRADAVGLT